MSAHQRQWAQPRHGRYQELAELRQRVDLLEARTAEHDRVLGALLPEFHIRMMEAERLGPARETGLPATGRKKTA